MLFTPTWAALYSWSVIEMVPYCIHLDLFEACLILPYMLSFPRRWSILLGIAG